MQESNKYSMYSIGSNTYWTGWSLEAWGLIRLNSPRPYWLSLVKLVTSRPY